MLFVLFTHLDSENSPRFPQNVEEALIQGNTIRVKLLLGTYLFGYLQLWESGEARVYCFLIHRLVPYLHPFIAKLHLKSGGTTCLFVPSQHSHDSIALGMDLFELNPLLPYRCLEVMTENSGVFKYHKMSHLCVILEDDI